MDRVFLHRVLSNKNGTFGVLIYNDRPICVTAEPPWLNNKKLVSCIPDGIYNCSKHNGVKYKNVWVLKSVKDRESILIHQGNFPLVDTNGCILVGSSYIINGVAGVSESIKTLNMLRAILPNDFVLDIKWVGQKN